MRSWLPRSSKRFTRPFSLSANVCTISEPNLKDMSITSPVADGDLQRRPARGDPRTVDGRRARLTTCRRPSSRSSSGTRSRRGGACGRSRGRSCRAGRRTRRSSCSIASRSAALPANRQVPGDGRAGESSANGCLTSGGSPSGCPPGAVATASAPPHPASAAAAAATRKERLDQARASRAPGRRERRERRIARMLAQMEAIGLSSIIEPNRGG